MSASFLGLLNDLESVDVGTRRQRQATLARGESASSIGCVGLGLASAGLACSDEASVEAVGLLRVAAALGRVLLDGAFGLAVEERLLLVVWIVVHLTLP